MTEVRDQKTPITMAPRLLLAATTNWPTAARLAGAFARLSWRVEVLAPAGTPAWASRSVHAGHAYSAFAPLESFKVAIAHAAPDLVIPCDDRACAHLIALHAQATALRNPDVVGLIARSLGAPRNYETLTTRPAFIAAAAALGIAVPRTRAVANEAELETALAEIGLPLVVKSDGSWGGDGVAIAYSREEARALFRRLSHPLSPVRSVLRALRRRDAHHLVAALAPVRSRLAVQALVMGRPATTTFAAWEGALLAAIHLDVAVVTGETGPASVVRRIHDPAMERAARSLARRFELSGLHGLDFIRDASGTVHLHRDQSARDPDRGLRAGRGLRPSRRARCARHGISRAGAHARNRQRSRRSVSAGMVPRSAKPASGRGPSRRALGRSRTGARPSGSAAPVRGLAEAPAHAPASAVFTSWKPSRHSLRTLIRLPLLRRGGGTGNERWLFAGRICRDRSLRRCARR